MDLGLLWLRLRGRYNFDNLARQDVLSAFSYRGWVSADFDFARFNQLLVQDAGLERLLAFDPSFISNSCYA